MLDIIYLSHGNRTDPSPLFQISEPELALFEDAFAALREKTGVLIDPYGSSRVYPDHLKILIDALGPSVAPRAREFVSCLQQAIAQNETLLFDGD